MADSPLDDDPKVAPRVRPARAPLPARSGAGEEIERKFLVVDPPEDFEQHPSELIEQGYLALDPEGAEVRLRRRAGRTLLTLKLGHGVARAEEEFSIAKARFERLWAGTSGRRVAKTRYEIPIAGGLTIELDVYDGDLAGLMTAEVEFGSRQQAAAWAPPAWMRLELTGNARYSNSRMAIDGIPDRKQVGEHSLLEGEPAGAGLVHVALAEIDAAADALQGRDAQEHAKAVHSARKSFKRLRALVRIARDGLGDEVADRDNHALQQAGARLSGARDAQVVVETLDDVLERSGGALDQATVRPLRESLTRARELADQAARQDSGALDEVVAMLEQVRADVATWDLGGQPADVLAAGFERIHKKGRQALKAAQKTTAEPDRTEALHELRKRAKDLWHAAELLEVSAPKRQRKLAAQAHKLADYLGDDHDLAVLREQLADHAGGLGQEADRAALEDSIAGRRRKLRRKGLALAEQIYGSSPGALAHRVRELDGS